MNHPEELLASFVDGSATPQERAEVQAHITLCPICREEIELARVALAALMALPEVEPPSLDLAFLPRDEASPSRGEPTRTPPSGRGPFVEAPDSDLAPAPRAIPHRPSLPSSSTVRRRWPVRAAQAMVAVAAVSLAVVFFAHLGGNQRNAATSAPVRAGEQAPAAGAASATQPGSEQSYTRKSLDSLAHDLAEEAGRQAPAALGSALTPAASPRLAASLSDRAVSCIEQGTGIVRGTYLFYVQRASYEGIDAYIGAFVQKTGNDRVMLVAAVSVDGCRPLRFIRQAI
jgi:hypothetical protein